MRELVPIVFVLKLGACNRFLLRSSYFTSLFLQRISTRMIGFLLIDTYKFEALIFANSLCELFVYPFLLEVLQMAD